MDLSQEVGVGVRTRKTLRPGDIGWGLDFSESSYFATSSTEFHRKATVSFANLPAEMKKEYLIEGINGKISTLPSPKVEVDASEMLARRHRTKGSGVSGKSDIEALAYSDGVQSTFKAFNRQAASTSPKRDNDLRDIFSSGNVSRFTGSSSVWSPKSTYPRRDSRMTGTTTVSGSSASSGYSTPARIGPIVPR